MLTHLTTDFKRPQRYRTGCSPIFRPRGSRVLVTSFCLSDFVQKKMTMLLNVAVFPITCTIVAVYLAFLSLINYSVFVFILLYSFCLFCFIFTRIFFNIIIIITPVFKSASFYGFHNNALVEELLSQTTYLYVLEGVGHHGYEHVDEHDNGHGVVRHEQAFAYVLGERLHDVTVPHRAQRE